jgi:hypothetical protein
MEKMEERVKELEKRMDEVEAVESTSFVVSNSSSENELLELLCDLRKLRTVLVSERNKTKENERVLLIY